MEGSEETSPLPPSKGEMRRASRHEKYDVGTNGRLGKARMAERTGTSGTSGSASRIGDYGTSETGGSARRIGDYGTSETGGSASQSQRMHGAGYVGAIVGLVGYCAKKTLLKSYR